MASTKFLSWWHQVVRATGFGGTVRDNSITFSRCEPPWNSRVIADRPRPPQKLLILVIGILRALIRMVHKPRSHTAPAQSSFQRALRQISSGLRAGRPSHDLSRIDIQNRRQ